MVIVGGGPVGMMLASELALAGVDFVVLERRPNQDLVGSRAGGLQSRAIELLDQRGIADRFLSEGKTVQAASFASVVLDISDFPTRHPYALGLFQNHIERLLAGWLRELNVRTEYGRDVSGFVQGDSGVEIEFSDGSSMSAQYVVGCDGGRSLVRRLAGIDFPGWDATVSNLIAEVEVTEEIPKGMRQDATGIHGLQLMADGRTVRIITTERQVGPPTEPGLDDLKQALKSVYGTDFGVHNPTWISRFTDSTRQAAAYRKQRVLLAGDSAHVHSPAGGQGLTLGFQDAVNLGWKLAQVVKGTSNDTLLDTYHAERHPAGQRALRYTMAQTAMMRPDNHTVALRETVADLCRMDAPRRLLGGLVSGLDTHYDLGEGHPQLGRRMPDLDLAMDDGSVRVFSLMHKARPLLLNLGKRGAIDVSAWSDRVRLVKARFGGMWELPVIGPVPAPAAVLVRPDGHVAWVGEG
ncbi:MAG: FAD-dependent monooxygenase, partial [Actinobacteria bacterium]|nr:FAD-dependent monooxygenase [Actinomycetota bacterium]